MAEVTNELLYEVFKSMQSRLDQISLKLEDVLQDVCAVRSHVSGLHQHVSNIYGILARHDARHDRIERRLDLVGTH